jgi:protein phosphatase PTC1
MIVRLDKSALLNSAKGDVTTAIGVEGDLPVGSVLGRISEVDKIVASAKRKAQTDGGPSLGVSGSNSGKGHEPLFAGEPEPLSRSDMEMEKVVEEEADDDEEEEDDDEEEDEECAEEGSDRNGARLVPVPEAIDPSLPTGAAKPAT